MWEIWASVLFQLLLFLPSLFLPTFVLSFPFSLHGFFTLRLQLITAATTAVKAETGDKLKNKPE